MEAFLLETGTRSGLSLRRPRALAFALAFGTGMTSGPSTAGAAVVAPIVGTGVAEALRGFALEGLGLGAYWGTTSSSMGTGAAPLLRERALGVVALGALGVVALGARGFGVPRPNG